MYQSLVSFLIKAFILWIIWAILCIDHMHISTIFKRLLWIQFVMAVTSSLILAHGAWCQKIRILVSCEMICNLKIIVQFKYSKRKCDVFFHYDEPSEEVVFLEMFSSITSKMHFLLFIFILRIENHTLHSNEIHLKTLFLVDAVLCNVIWKKNQICMPPVPSVSLYKLMTFIASKNHFKAFIL